MPQRQTWFLQPRSKIFSNLSPSGQKFLSAVPIPIPIETPQNNNMVTEPSSVSVVKSGRNSSASIKFLCSYGGRISPRRSDGKLRYVGGFTRILAVERSVSYAELMVKLVEFCGFSVTLRCPLPDGDLETLISVKSDEDLANVIEEYQRASPDKKIRAILSPPDSVKQVSPPLSTVSSVDLSHYKSRMMSGEIYARQSRSPARRFPVGLATGEGKPRCVNPRGGPMAFRSAPCCHNCTSSCFRPKEVPRN